MKLHMFALLGLATIGTVEAQTYTIARLGPLGAVTGLDSNAVSIVPKRVALDASAKTFGTILGTTYVATESQVIAFGPAHNVTAIVGAAYRGFAGEGAPASAALLDTPSSLAVAANGDLYIADSGNFRVRKVHNGFISTVAGSGDCLHGLGDGGPALSACLNAPVGIAFDTSGNLFIAESTNQRIRRVDAITNIITTVAGGGLSLADGVSALTAHFYQPRAVAVDLAGDIFVADYQSHQVRMIDSGTHLITTVAGIFGFDSNPFPYFDQSSPVGTEIGQPLDLALDQLTGRLWIASTTGLFAVSQALHHIAKAPDPATPGAVLGIVVDGGSNVLLAAVPQSHLLFFSPAPGPPTATIAGTYTPLYGNGFRAYTADGLDPIQSQGGMCGVTYDADGSLYYGDMEHHIRKITGYATIATIAGTGDTTSSGDGGLALNAGFANPCQIKADGHGHLLVADTAEIRRIDLASGIVTKFADVAAQRMALDKSGNLYFTNTNNQVQRVDAVSGTVTLVAGSGGAFDDGDGGLALNAGLGAPRGIAFDASGAIYIATYYSIRKINPTTGIITTFAGNGLLFTDGIAATQAWIQPGELFFDARGNLLFPDSAPPYSSPVFLGDSRKVRRISPLGIIDTIAGTGDFGNSGDGAAAKLAVITAGEPMAQAPNGDLAILQTSAASITENSTNELRYARILTPHTLPFLIAGFQSKADGATPGSRVWTLTVTNTGPGASLNPRVINVTDTVIGPGPVTLSPTLPASLGASIQPGATTTYQLNLNFPATAPITRISLTLTMTDDSGQIYSLTFNNLFR